MSSNTPTSLEPDDHAIYLLGRVGQRTQMTRVESTPCPPPRLPPPPQMAEARPQLPPLANLPGASSLSASPGQYATAMQYNRPQSSYSPLSPFGQSPAPAGPTSWPNIAYQEQSGRPVTHPALYPQRASFQSKNPGIVYEASSPIEYGSSGPSSLFNEASYSQPAYPSGPISTFQSPTGSHRSSTTSSSGAGSSEGSARPSLYQPSIPETLAGPPGALNTIQDRYVLTVRQHPLAARACGFGERDRRVIDPPPIVQLSLKNYDPTSKADVSELRYPFNIMHCALLSVPPNAQAPKPPTSAPYSFGVPVSSDVTAVPDPNQHNRLSQRLIGTLVASPFVAVDPDAPESTIQHGRLGTFFIFSDLSCRQNGYYRLRFTLMKVPMGPETNEGGRGSVCGSIDSEEFQVYSAKDFPGMSASSKLIRELKKQGAAVNVRKGKDRRSTKEAGKRASSVSGSADEDEEAEGSARQLKKRG